MPCYTYIFTPTWSGRKEPYSDYVIKKLTAYGKIENILNFKYCSFAIIDKEKDMLEKIRKVTNE